MAADDLTDWTQLVVQFADRATVEPIAVRHLRPVLTGARRWWFIRKHPHWRVRLPAGDQAAINAVTAVLDSLAEDGTIQRWHTSVYEPETHAFGGPAAMALAHDLFHHDSQGVLDYLDHLQHLRAGSEGGVGRRELSVLLIGVLLRAAGLDWFEQGDVWATVADLRRAPDQTPPDHALTHRPGGSEHLQSMTRLLTVDAGPASTLAVTGPLAPFAGRITAFERAGQHLATLAAHGVLRRGLRAVLAHHVIFAWNRHGLTRADQHILSTSAKEIIFMPTPTPIPTPTVAPGDSDAARLRTELVEHLRDAATVRTTRVEEALRAVPRHVFVPEASLTHAYADSPIYTKSDGSGVSISAASQPTIVAMMLEQLDPPPGSRVLELGAGTGYNAALLAHLVSPHGQVVTVDVDDDLVTGARAHLAAAGTHTPTDNVTVVLGDGALGHPDNAPYDRIIATVGAWGVPTAWLDQLAPGGRLLVPLRIRGSVSRAIAFEHHAGRWVSVDSQLSTFMPLRGIADDARRIVSLTPDNTVTLQTHQDQHIDPAALAGVLDRPRHQTWTGVSFRGPESMEWMDLWLTCTLPGGLSRMPVDRARATPGLVTPQFGWGSMATVDHTNLAYLTLRPTDPAPDPAPDGATRYEIGVIGHGHHGDQLADQVTDAVQQWDRTHRGRPATFEILTADHTSPNDPLTGQFHVSTPLHTLAITWL